MNEKTASGYDILYPETSTEQVVDVTTGKTVADHLSSSTKDAHTISNIVGLQDALDAKSTGDTTEIAKQINTLYKLSISLIRSEAYRTLKENAESRIDGGTVFAHDMNGNLIGMTLDEANSQNIVIRDGKMLMLAKSEVTKTVTDATVVAGAYDTSGNGGRKLVRLANGSFVVATKTTTAYYLYKSIDNGLNWTLLYSNTGLTSFQDVAIASKDIYVYVIYGANNNAVNYHVINSLDGTRPFVGGVDSSQTALGNVSLAINSEGTELHAAWRSKSPTLPNSFNIRYAKGVINQVDGSVTWGTVEQRTTYNTTGQYAENPSIIINSKGHPVVLHIYHGGIQSTYYNGSSWATVGIYTPGTTYAQSSPSAIFVPKSVNGIANGRIWVAWHGTDATDTTTKHIRVSYSDDGGVTWSAMQKLTSGGVKQQESPSITVSKDNKIHIVWEGYPETNNWYNIRTTSYDGGLWKPITNLTNTTSSASRFPSTLIDMSITFDTTLLIYKDERGKVGFFGTWKEPVETPTLTAKAVYNIPSTDFLGAFIKKIGMTTVKAYVNDVLVDAELVDNEYGFTKQLDTKAPVKLRLDLSRVATTGGENDAVTRILGGRA